MEIFGAECNYSLAFSYLCKDILILKRIDYMKFWKLTAALILALVGFAACSDDDKDGSVAFDRKALFMSWEESVTVGISGVNIRTFGISAVPDGWETPEVNTQTMSVDIVAPAADTEGVESSGNITLRGISHEGDAVYATLFVSLDTPEIDFTEQPANSYIANKGGAIYRINASVKPDGTRLATERVDVIWQASMSYVKYLQLEEDGTATFFMANNDDEDTIKAGNALIGAFDADDNLLWSWHIWAVDYDADKEALAYGDYKVMSRNLGQLQNATDTEANILASYGLYYQWGRKDPFPGPSVYNASKGTTVTLFDGESNTVKIAAVAADAETGTYSYTNAHPTHFITVSDNNGAWDKGISSETRGWNGSEKSVNDPCPYGWRVASAEAFEGLAIVDDLAVEDAATKYAKQYGWTLKKGDVESFYFAAGRRLYVDALIQNIYDEWLTRNVAIEAQPWVGYTWTSVGGNAFAFWFNKANPTESSLRNDLKIGTANGLSVRCVKE